MNVSETLIEIRAKLKRPTRMAMKKIKDLCKEKNIEISMEENDNE